VKIQSRDTSTVPDERVATLTGQSQGVVAAAAEICRMIQVDPFVAQQLVTVAAPIANTPIRPVLFTGSTTIRPVTPKQDGTPIPVLPSLLTVPPILQRQLLQAAGVISAPSVDVNDEEALANAEGWEDNWGGINEGEEASGDVQDLSGTKTLPPSFGSGRISPAGANGVTKILPVDASASHFAVNTANPAATGVAPGNTTERQCTIFLEVTDLQAANIIGKNGCNLKPILAATGVQLQLSQKGEYIPETLHRQVTIAGGIGAVHMAHAMVLEKADEVAPNAELGPPFHQAPV
jgi:hypothetical protein